MQDHDRSRVRRSCQVFVRTDRPPRTLSPIMPRSSLAISCEAITCTVWRRVMINTRVCDQTPIILDSGQTYFSRSLMSHTFSVNCDRV